MVSTNVQTSFLPVGVDSLTICLVWTFVETIDLFEDVTAIYYDYSSLRKRFAHSNILKNISGFIRQVSNELDQVGMAIQNNSQYTVLTDFDYHLRALKDEIDMMAKPGEENTPALEVKSRKIRDVVKCAAGKNQLLPIAAP